ncbi:MAG: DinB family protein, partial [Ignavibacteria bacterium]
MDRPTAEEYPEYYNQYINLVKDGDIISILEEQSSYVQKFIASIPEEKGNSTYGFGKWTIKEVFGHLLDSERILAFRALRIARKDKQPLSGYEQDDYVKNAKYYRKTLK